MSAPAIVTDPVAFRARVVAEIQRHAGKFMSANSVDAVFRKEGLYGPFVAVRRAVGVVERGRAAKREYLLPGTVASHAATSARAASLACIPTASAPTADPDAEAAIAARIASYLPRQRTPTDAPHVPAHDDVAIGAAIVHDDAQLAAHQSMVLTPEKEALAQRVISHLPRHRAQAEQSAAPVPNDDAAKPGPPTNPNDDDDAEAEAARRISRHLRQPVPLSSSETEGLDPSRRSAAGPGTIIATAIAHCEFVILAAGNVNAYGKGATRLAALG